MHLWSHLVIKDLNNTTITNKKKYAHQHKNFHLIINMSFLITIK